MHVIKFAGKITSRFPRVPFQLINKPTSSISKMPPTVKANEPVIDYAGMANLNLYLCLFCFAIRIFTNQLPALIVRIDNAMNKLTKFPDL